MVRDDGPPESGSDGLLDEMVQRWEFLPNSLRAMKRNPELLEAALELVKVVMHDDGRIGLELKWLVAHITSRAAGCRYCSAHSGHFSQKLAKAAQEKIDSIWTFETSDLFTEAERAALRVALGAGVTPNSVTSAQMAELRGHFDEDEVIEIVAVIGLFGFFNRWNDTFSTELEDGPRGFAERHLSSMGPGGQGQPGPT